MSFVNNIKDLQAKLQDEKTHEKTVEQIVGELSKLDDFAIQTIAQGLKAIFAGKKGRIQGYEWMKKAKPAPSGRGKGRPQDAPEVKIAKLEAKLEQQKSELLSGKQAKPILRKAH